jgi:hypothetical protein
MTLKHAHIQMRNVMVADGLRVHICPKVATAAISSAMHGSGYHHASPQEDGDEYRWMCVRHPLDRLVSCWAFFCRSESDHEIRGQHDLLLLGYYHGMPFAAFLDVALKQHNKNAHTRKQSIYAGGQTFDRLCRLHNLDREWAKLQAKFPYLTRPMMVVHKSNHSDWQDYYTDAQREAAEREFSDDLALYESSA